MMLIFVGGIGFRFTGMARAIRLIRMMGLQGHFAQRLEVPVVYCKERVYAV
jgi:hypothetical protein